MLWFHLPSAGRSLTEPGTAFGVGMCSTVLSPPPDSRLPRFQDWPPFVLVSGLLLIGLLADDDGVFAAAGHRLARTSRSGVALFVGAALMIGLVTAALNLNTSVAFLTPVLAYAARSRGEAEAALLYP